VVHVALACAGSGESGLPKIIPLFPDMEMATEKKGFHES
jgi:hypothetical protein